MFFAVGGRVWWSSGDAAALAAPDNPVSMLSHEEHILACELLDCHFVDHGRWHLAIFMNTAHGNVALGVLVTEGRDVF